MVSVLTRLSVTAARFPVPCWIVLISMSRYRVYRMPSWKDHRVKPVPLFANASHRRMSDNSDVARP